MAPPGQGKQAQVQLPPEPYRLWASIASNHHGKIFSDVSYH